MDRRILGREVRSGSQHHNSFHENDLFGPGFIEFQNCSWNRRHNDSELAGATVLEAEVIVDHSLIEKSDKQNYSMSEGKKENVKTVFIPYYAWNNRFDTRSTGGSPEMKVWIPVIDP